MPSSLYKHPFFWGHAILILVDPFLFYHYSIPSNFDTIGSGFLEKLTNDRQRTKAEGRWTVTGANK